MKPTGLGLIALTLALVGCQSGVDERADSGQAPAGQTAENVEQSRGQLGEAFVEAARVHAMVARKDSGGANKAVRELRDELATAKATAPLDIQSRINELDQLAIETQQAIATNTPEALETSGRLVDELQLAMGGTGGGAGLGPDRMRLEASPPAGTVVPPAAPNMLDQPDTREDEPGDTVQPAPGAGTDTGPGTIP